MSASSSPRGRNVVGRPCEARLQLDRIQDPENGYWTPSSNHSPNTRYEERSDTSPDRRRNSKGRSVVLAEYTREGLQLLWDLSQTNLRVEGCDQSIDPAERCWIWTSYKPGGGRGGKHDLSVPPFSDELGYPVISRGHGLAKIKVHQLAVWIRDGTFIRHGMNASHMCHTPACANPAHLRAETINLNRLRQGCPCWKWLDPETKTTRACICTHGDPDNDQPFCLRPDIKGIEERGHVWDPTSASGWRKRNTASKKRDREVVSLVEDTDEEPEEPPAIERPDDGFYYDQNGDRIYG